MVECCVIYYRIAKSVRFGFLESFLDEQIVYTVNAYNSILAYLTTLYEMYPKITCSFYVELSIRNEHVVGVYISP